MKWTHVMVALSLLLAVGLAPAVAQTGRPQIDPPPEEPMSGFQPPNGPKSGG